MALLADKALSFGDRDALKADLLEGLFHLIKLELLVDRFDLFHSRYYLTV